MWGVPKLLFSLSRRLLRRTKEEKEVFRGHPEPRQRAAALCNPAQRKSVRERGPTIPRRSPARATARAHPATHHRPCPYYTTALPARATARAHPATHHRPCPYYTTNRLDQQFP